jgi:hypothetical protein
VVKRGLASATYLHIKLLPSASSQGPPVMLSFWVKLVVTSSLGDPKFYQLMKEREIVASNPSGTSDPSEAADCNGITGCLKDDHQKVALQRQEVVR